MDFFKKFFITGFEIGDYTYGFVHITFLVLMLISLFIVPFLLHRKSSGTINRIVKILGIIMLSIYFTRRLIQVFKGGNIISSLYPFYLCNVCTILVGLCAIFKWKHIREFAFVAGIIGGIVTFAFPQGIFTDRYINFNVLDSVTSHWGIILIPIIMWTTGECKLEFKNIWKVFVGTVIVFINVQFLQYPLVGTRFDYLFLGDNMPLQIPGIPTFLIMPILFPIVVLLIYSIAHLINKHYLANEIKN